MRKRANCLVGGSIACLLLTSPALCGVDETTKGNWTIAHGDAKKILAVQCGFHVTVFVLEYFGVEYPVNQVSLGLPLTEKGASLADVEQMIGAFGLETSPRTGVGIRQVAKSLDRNTLAIIPLTAGEELNHYYVAALDNQGRPVLVNVPRGVSPLNKLAEDDRIDERLQGAGGVVLFVRKNEKPSPPMADQIRVAPSPIELGGFLVSGPDFVAELDARASLTNVSSSAIMVSRVQTSCGCTDPDWTGGLLRAGETRPLQFVVYAGAWGRGAQEKLVVLTCADRSECSFTIRGTGIEPEEQHRIDVSSDSVNIDLSQQRPRESVDVRVTRVRPYGNTLDEVVVATDVPWLSPRLVPTDQHAAELWVEIDTDRVLPELVKGSSRVVGKVTLSTRTDVAPVEVSVIVFRRDFFHLSQNMLRLRARGGGASEVSVLPNDRHVRLEVVDVRSESPSLSVKVRNHEGISVLTVQTDGAETISPGYYLVECDVESSLGARAVARLVVDVRP